jgi:hypothetical protein
MTMNVVLFAFKLNLIDYMNLDCEFRRSRSGIPVQGGPAFRGMPGRV